MMPFDRNSLSGRDACPPHPRAAAGTAPDGRRSPRAVWGHLKRLNARFEASWVGDLIGVICLFATFYVLFFIGGILQ